MVFRRGELKLALLDALGTVGPANGYVIMQTIADELGGAWQPSPGAVYPALLGLEDAGLITAHDHAGSRVYSLSSARARPEAAGTLAAVAARTRGAPKERSAGRVLDEWIAGIAGRNEKLDERRQKRLTDVLEGIQRQIEQEVRGHG
ncbi:MAG: PadR family transcriptional regulator [Acidimicrobiales bacterium]